MNPLFSRDVQKGDRLREVLNPEMFNALNEQLAFLQSGKNIKGGAGVFVNSGDGAMIRIKKPFKTVVRPVPWQIRSDGTIVPGTVSYGGTVVPTMNNVRLDASPAPVLTDIGFTGSGTEYFYLKCTWVTTFTNGYLDLPLSLPQGNVIVERHTSAPTPTSSVHYVLLATFVGGTLTANPLTTSPLPVTLWDNGYDAAVMKVGNL